MHVVEEEHQRRSLHQRLGQARHGLEQPPPPHRLILGDRREIGIAFAQLGQQACQLGQPQVPEQVVGGVLALQAGPQRRDQRRVGQATLCLEGPPDEHLGVLAARPVQELGRQAGLATAGLAFQDDDLCRCRLGTCVGLAEPRELAPPPH